MAARWDWGVGICDFWDLQANPKEAHDSWDLANPKVGIWDFGAFGTSRRLLGFHLGFWGYGGIRFIVALFAERRGDCRRGICSVVGALTFISRILTV